MENVENLKINLIKFFSLLMFLIMAFSILNYCHYFNLSLLTFFGLFILFSLFFFFLQTLAHELGHLIGGLVSGYDLLIFRIFIFAITSTKDGLRLKLYNIPGSLGQCIMAPGDNMSINDFPYLLYNYGGILANIFISIMSLIIGYHLAYPYIFLAIAFAVVGFLLIANNLIPIKGVPNDGTNIKALKKSSLSRKSLYFILTYTKYSVKGKEPIKSSLNFYNLSKGEKDNSLIRNLGLNQIEYYIYNNQLKKALDLGEFMVKNKSMDIIDYYYLTEILSIYLLLGAYDKVDRILSNKDFSKYLDLSNTINTVRTKYQLEVLYNKNIKTAEKSLKKFNKNKVSHPFTSEVRTGEKMINRTKKSYKYEKITLKLDTIDSTNRLAKDLAMEGSPYRIIIANSQSKGQGQRDKEFISPKGGLYMSVILRPNYSIDQVKYLTGRVAIAIIEALKESINLDCQVKWINDIIYKDNKLGGILTESSIKGKDIDYIVVGIGINIENTSKTKEFASLDLPLEKTINLINYYLLPKLFKIENSSVEDDFIEKYNQYLYKRNSLVEFELKGQVDKGLLKGVDENMDIIIGEEHYSYGQIKLMR